MVTKEQAKPSDNGSKEDKDYTTNAAQLRLVNLIFDPDERHILSLCRIRTSREAFLHASQITKEQALNVKRDLPLSAIWRNAYLLLSRSINMHAFNMGVGLARNQNEAENEAQEEAEL